MKNMWELLELWVASILSVLLLLATVVQSFSIQYEPIEQIEPIVYEIKMVDAIIDNEPQEQLEEIRYNAFHAGHKPTEYEIDMICRLMSCEVGDRNSGVCNSPDWVVQYTVSVLINRVNHPAFADTIYDVIYEPRQYQPAIDGTIDSAKYDDNIRDNVEYCLMYGSVIPDDVCYQSQYKKNGSGIYEQWTSNVTGATIYFNYI